MSMLLLQTFLLMLTAFFLGALVACLFKSAFFSTASERTTEAMPAAVAPVPVARPAATIPKAPPRPAPDLVSPRIETVARPSSVSSMPLPDAQRFERALTGQAATAGAAAPAPTAKSTPPPVPVPPAKAVPHVEISPAEPVKTPSVAKQEGGAAAAAAAAATAAAVAASRTILPSAAGSSGPASVAAEVSISKGPGPTPAPASADDLKRIRAIDSALEAQLNALGVRRYAEIAAWSGADVQRIGQATGLSKRISSENWIEQAQILAKGGVTDYAQRAAAQVAGIAMASPTPDQGAAAPVRGQAPSVATAPPTPTPATSTAAAAASGSVPFAQAKSGAQAAAAAAAAIAAAAAATVRRNSPSAVSTPAPAERDDLQRVNGINSETEKLLNAEGVTRFAQIAGWTAADTDRFNGLLGVPGRIARENWIEQAAVLASGGGAYARRTDLPPRPADAEAPRPTRLVDAIREREDAARSPDKAIERPAASERAPVGRPDLSNLRSVRSEHLRRDVGQGAAVDDLKRIRGIGVLIEKKLNSLGVSNFEQIANWTGADIDRVSQILDFKGRIERENWVEQARILASGGQTEFSLRVDKGQV